MLGTINRQLTITPRLNQILQKEGLICDHQRKEELYLEVVHLIWKSESSSPNDLSFKRYLRDVLEFVLKNVSPR